MVIGCIGEEIGVRVRGEIPGQDGDVGVRTAFNEAAGHDNAGVIGGGNVPIQQDLRRGESLSSHVGRGGRAGSGGGKDQFESIRDGDGIRFGKVIHDANVSTASGGKRESTKECPITGVGLLIGKNDSLSTGGVDLERNAGRSIRAIDMPLVNIVVATREDVGCELHILRAAAPGNGQVVCAEGIRVTPGRAEEVAVVESPHRSPGTSH